MNTVDRLFGITNASHSALVGGFLAGTQVYTADGMIPVEYLAPGDRIVTGKGLVPLLSLTTKRVAKATLVRIRAATQTNAMPWRDLLLGPDQPVVIRDWRAQAMFGRRIAAVPAARLVDGEFVVAEQRHNAWLFFPGFGADTVLYAEGLETALSGADASSVPAQRARTGGT